VIAVCPLCCGVLPVDLGHVLPLCVALVYCAHVCVVLSLWAYEQTDGATPLIAASWGGHVEVVRALVYAGAEVNHAKV
jgi:hypothetical protein